MRLIWLTVHSKLLGNEALTQARKNRLVQMGEKRATAVLKNPTVAAMQHQAEQLVLVRVLSCGLTLPIPHTHKLKT